jgi:hypothetical protein
MEVTEQEKEFAYVMIENMINHYVAIGMISEEEYNDKDKAYAKVISFLQDESIGNNFVIDSRDELLKTAEEFIIKKEYHNAIVFYAMYLEHWINNLIDILCAKRKMSRKSIKEILKNVNIIAKYTWILELLEQPAIADADITLIRKTSEERNSYIHYKYNTVVISLHDKIEETKSEQDEESKISEIRNLVKRLQEYEIEQLYPHLKKKS